MATYEEIYGKRVKEFTSDPTLDSSYEGQVWYNSNTETLKSVVSFASWTAAPDMSQARRSAGGFGVQTAAVIVGGDNGAGTFFYRNVEEYNGTGFSTGTNIPEMGAPNPGNYLGITDMGQAGTETAGLIFGGESYTRPGNMTAEYDGSSWTITGNMNNLRRGTGCGGTQTAAFACGGYDGSNRAYTENYNGSSWTNSGALNTAMMCANGRANLAPQTAGLVFGGSVVPGDTTRTTTEEYDGSNWTTGGALNNATVNASGGGTQTAGLKFGGGPPETSAISSTENYDGSSWTTGTNIGTLRRQTAGVGSQTAAVAAGGRTTTNLATTEEYNVSINTITAAAWSSGGAIPSAAMRSGAGTGTQTAGLLAAGYTNTIVAESYEYDGSSWTATNDLPAVRYNIVGVGTQTASLLSGGIAPPSNTLYAETFTYNGSTFSDTGYDLPGARSAGGMFGTQTAAVYAAGSSSVGPANAVTNSYEYDGEGWTAGNSISTARNNLAGFGTQTAGAICNGYIPGGGGYSSATEEYDGTNWSTGGTMVVGSSGCRASGSSQTDAIVFSGRSSANNGEQRTFAYDGTAWASQPSMGNNHYQQAQAGTSSTTTWIAGGGPKGSGTPDNVTNTEEFTPVTETATAKTLTTS